MKTFEVDLEFIDSDNDLIKKTLELTFISQRFINRATDMFAKIIHMQTLQKMINEKDDYIKQIKADESITNKDELLKNIKINVKEAQKTIRELITKDLYKEKLILIMDILKKNGIEDPRFYDFDFWDKDVDPHEIQAFLEDLISRGKKKELEKSLKMNLKPITEAKKEKESII